MKSNCRIVVLLIVTLFLATCILEKEKVENSHPLTGSYLGQTLPTDSAVLFAPGVVSTQLYTRDIAIMPDGKEIYFCISALGYNLIYTTKQIEGVWSEPEVASFVSDESYMFFEPHIAPDGKTLFFLSNMPAKEGIEASEDIWAVDRVGDDWGEPYNLGSPINTDGAEFYPSVTLDGTLYFTRAERGSRIHNIYRSRKVDGQYQAAEKLAPEVNCGTNRYNAYIDSEERFIIIPAVGMEDSRGGTDYYISFRDENDSWSKAVNMGDKINSTNPSEYSASLSPDGKYLFFMSSKTTDEVSSSYTDLLEAAQSPLNGNSNIWWIKSDFIWDLNANSS